MSRTQSTKTPKTKKQILDEIKEEFERLSPYEKFKKTMSKILFLKKDKDSINELEFNIYKENLKAYVQKAMEETIGGAKLNYKVQNGFENNDDLEEAKNRILHYYIDLGVKSTHLIQEYKHLELLRNTKNFDLLKEVKKIEDKIEDKFKTLIAYLKGKKIFDYYLGEEICFSEYEEFSAVCRVINIIEEDNIKKLWDKKNNSEEEFLKTFCEIGLKEAMPLDAKEVLFKIMVQNNWIEEEKIDETYPAYYFEREIEKMDGDDLFSKLENLVYVKLDENPDEYIKFFNKINFQTSFSDDVIKNKLNDEDKKKILIRLIKHLIENKIENTTKYERWLKPFNCEVTKFYSYYRINQKEKVIKYAAKEFLYIYKERENKKEFRIICESIGIEKEENIENLLKIAENKENADEKEFIQALYYISKNEDMDENTKQCLRKLDRKKRVKIFKSKVENLPLKKNIKDFFDTAKFVLNQIVEERGCEEENDGELYEEKIKILNETIAGKSGKAELENLKSDWRYGPGNKDEIKNKAELLDMLIFILGNTNDIEEFKRSNGQYIELLESLIYEKVKKHFGTKEKDEENFEFFLNKQEDTLRPFFECFLPEQLVTEIIKKKNDSKEEKATLLKKIKYFVTKVASDEAPVIKKSESMTIGMMIDQIIENKNKIVARIDNIPANYEKDVIELSKGSLKNLYNDTEYHLNPYNSVPNKDNFLAKDDEDLKKCTECFYRSYFKNLAENCHSFENIKFWLEGKNPWDNIAKDIEEVLISFKPLTENNPKHQKRIETFLIGIGVEYEKAEETSKKLDLLEAKLSARTILNAICASEDVNPTVRNAARSSRSIWQTNQTDEEKKQEREERIATWKKVFKSKESLNSIDFDEKLNLYHIWQILYNLCGREITPDLEYALGLLIKKPIPKTSDENELYKKLSIEFINEIAETGELLDEDSKEKIWKISALFNGNGGVSKFEMNGEKYDARTLEAFEEIVKIFEKFLECGGASLVESILLAIANDHEETQRQIGTKVKYNTKELKKKQEKIFLKILMKPEVLSSICQKF